MARNLLDAPVESYLSFGDNLPLGETRRRGVRHVFDARFQRSTHSGTRTMNLPQQLGLAVCVVLTIWSLTLAFRAQDKVKRGKQVRSALLCAAAGLIIWIMA